MPRSPDQITTLTGLLAFRARTSPAKIAVIVSDREVSYEELWESITAFAAHLTARGLCPGDRVLMALPNSKEFFTAFYGTILAGGIAAPVFPNSGQERLASMARLCGAAHTLSLSNVQVYLDHRPTGAANFPAVKPGGAAYIQYTSGSTGNPKGVMLSHANLLTNTRQMIAGFHVTGRDVFVSWLPACHDMGLILMTMVPFYMGVPVILLKASLKNIRHWLHAIEQYRGTFTAAPDFAYRLCLLYTTEPERYDLSSLRVALNAAEPVRAPTIKNFEQRFNIKNVVTPAYGLAEATVGVSTWPPGKPVKVDKRGLVSVGQPFPGVSLKILAKGKEANAGEIGEILVKSPANTTGYWNNNEESRRLFYNPSFIRTGDLGCVDSDGNLYIAGREKNLIIQAGRSIAPQEVEELVDAIPFIRFSAAVGIDAGGREGEQVYIFAEPRRKGSFKENELFEMSVQITARFNEHFGFRPGKVLLLKPGALPFTANGKLKHSQLKHDYTKGNLNFL
jgi:acyl-CoA synthetase (AMP-forming)/AMP-acid ligase II